MSGKYTWRGYYIINRRCWPDMTRRRAFWSALKAMWMLRKVDA